MSIAARLVHDECIDVQGVSVSLRKEHRSPKGKFMKTRDSGMPDETYWQTFFDPIVVLTTLGLNQIAGPVIDVGAGYGTFTFAIATMTQHPVIAIDIEPLLVEDLVIRAGIAGLHHVEGRLRDVTRVGLGVASGSADIVLLFNLLHCEEPVALLRAAREVLRPAGRVGIIHWRRDVPTPRGPALSIRPEPQTCVDWLVQAGLSIERPPVTLPPYHFGLVGIKS